MKNTLPEMLRQFKDGRISEDKLLHFLKDLPYQDLEFAKGIVKAIEKNGAPSFPQIKVANKILNNARAKGFS